MAEVLGLCIHEIIIYLSILFIYLFIYLFIHITARSAERGAEAIKQLESEGLAPELLLLDVSDKLSIETAQKTVADKYGRLDILVNNAGIMMKV